MCYTYLIGWSKQNLWYYGSRYSKNAKPEDLWVTYFTSSKYVKKIVKEYGDPDIIQIRKIFYSAINTQNWEKKVLRRLNVLYEDKWLNKNVGGRIYIEKQTEEHVKKRIENKKHNPKQKEFALYASRIAAEKRKGTRDSEETKIKRNTTLKETLRKQKEMGIKRITRKKFLIDGIIYNGLEGVMSAFNISMPTVYNRIKSNKFPNWNYYGI